MSVATPFAFTLPSTAPAASQPPATSVLSSSVVKSDSQPPNITQTFAQLKHEKKNQNLSRLPPSHTVGRRPIIHGPIASPFADSGVQKVVYVSSKTPLMSAVKRVRKFMQQIEKRKMQDVKLIDRGEREGVRKLADAKERMAEEKEEVLVKASGRAMAKAIAVGKWFEEKEKEWQVGVEARSGSVSVVDDVLEVDKEESEEPGGGDAEEVGQQREMEVVEEESRIEGGDMTMELFGINEQETPIGTSPNNIYGGDSVAKGSTEDNDVTEALGDSASGAPKKSKRKRRRTKKRKTYDQDNVPEQRLRWIKTVEVAISFMA